MKIIILITVVETLILTLWMAYSYYKRQQLDSRTTLAQTLSTTNGPSINSRIPTAAHWSAMNGSQLGGQQDDRQPMNGSVAKSNEVSSSVRRAFARKSHQLMYKKWSRDRHDS